MKKLVLSMIAVVFAIASFAQCSDIFISEYSEGGGNNKSLEFYNPTAADIDLTNYRLIRYSNGSTTSDTDPKYVLGLTGTIASYDVWVYTIDRRDSLASGQDTAVVPELQALTDVFASPDYNTNSVMSFNGDDALCLQKDVSGTWTTIDIIGEIGVRPTGGWTMWAPYDGSTGSGPWMTKNMTMKRKSSVQGGVTTNPSPFIGVTEWDTVGYEVWTDFQMHTCDCYVGLEEEVETQVNLYPNPVTDNMLTIKANKNINSITVVSIIGQEVMSLDNTSNSKIFAANLNNITEGIYMIRINFVDNSYSLRKVIVK